MFPVNTEFSNRTHLPPASLIITQHSAYTLLSGYTPVISTSWEAKVEEPQVKGLHAYRVSSGSGQATSETLCQKVGRWLGI